MTDEKNPIGHVVEVAVYAPIGFVLEARRLLPSFVERGRQQVNMAKVVGQFAVTHGQTTATKKLAKVQAQAGAVLTEFGVTQAATPAAAPTAAAPTSTPGAPATPAPAPVRSSEAAIALPIADYDSLAASQVIPRLAGLSEDELQAVHDYEVSHRGRKTILGKITQLGGA
ncbi:hypothetical protein [Aquihabitans sp. McL0605]|uniref:hypothetical protein n=1 Tax=Aquihabitans sp. McL0605 TaxID=3415671 RepID=UPI003CF44936